MDNYPERIEEAKAKIKELEKAHRDAIHEAWCLRRDYAIQKSGRPVYDYRKFRSPKLNIEKAHETKVVWWDTGTFNDNSLSNMEIWVCKYCKTPQRTKYIATGHDHTDYSYHVCDCDGAQKNGKPYKDLK